jgi:hypothetical protein
MRSKRPPLKAIVIQTKITPESMKELVYNYSGLDDFKIEIIQLSSDLYRIELIREINEGAFKGNFLLDTSNSGSWIIFTNGNDYFVSHVIESFFDKLYPKVSRIYFNLEQMKKFVDIIKEEYGGKSTFTNFTIKRKKKLWKLSGDEKPKKGTLTLWEEDADEEIKTQSDYYNLQIMRLNFNIRDNYNFMLLRANISRKGKCSLHYGNFNNFYYNVILKIIEYGISWREFYSERERNLKNNEIFLNPFTITYPEKINISDIRKLAKHMSNIYSCSIIHNGNPYFVANISDYLDGSSFGLTALGNIVTITPISKGTVEATWKLTETIQQILGDGSIVNVDIG